MQQGLSLAKTPPAIKKQAGALALGLFGALWCLFWTLRYVQPAPLPLPVNEGIEVNLGDGQSGSGTTSPQGQPLASHLQAVAEQVVTSPALIAEKPVLQPNTTAAPSKEPSPSNKAVVAEKLLSPDPGPEPLPPPPQPKALLRAGALTATTTAPVAAANKSTGTMGIPNEQNKSQGIATGTGDQGDPRGNPNSNHYRGNAASGTTGPGVQIRNGLSGRKLVKWPQFEDDFSENAKVAVDIVVDASGKITDARINPRGTTTANAQIRSMALQKAKTLQLNPSAEAAESGTLVFVFVVHN